MWAVSSGAVCAGSPSAAGPSCRRELRRARGPWDAVACDTRPRSPPVCREVDLTLSG